MSATLIEPASLYRAEGLRHQANGRNTPTFAALADTLRASASALFDGFVPDAADTDAPPISGRRIRLNTADRLRPIFSIGHAGLGEFALDSEHGDDVSSPELRVAFDALIEVGDFIDAGGGRIFPSRTRVVRLAESTWGILSGNPTPDLAFGSGALFGRSFMRVTSTPPPAVALEQSLASWLGLRTLDYTDYAQDQMRRPLMSQREDATSWLVARVAGPTTEWIEANKWSDFAQPLLVRRRRDKNSPWERFVARLKPAVGGVECVEARQISFVDCGRILHGRKASLGFGRSVRATPTPLGLTVTCDSYELPELRRVLLALSYDWFEREDRLSFAVTADLQRELAALLSGMGFNLLQR